MSTTDPVSRSGSETVALAPNTAQHGNNTPPRVETAGYDLSDLQSAIGIGNHELATSIFGKLSEEDKNDCATLHWALQYGFYDFVPELINSATDKNKLVTTPNDSGMTALHLAMSRSEYDCESALVNIINQLVQSVQPAVESSTYVLAKDHRGLTALHHAVGHGWGPKILECLINAAADKDACLLREQTEEGETALHYAALGGSFDQVESLVNRFYNSPDYVNMTCNRELTALHQAALTDTPDVAVCLLQNGANATIQDEHGNTAWDIACIPKVERVGKRAESWKFLAALLLWENDNKNAEYLDRISRLDDQELKLDEREKLVYEKLKFTNDRSKLANEEAKLDDEQRELDRKRKMLFDEENGIWAHLLTTNMDQINAHLCSVAYKLYRKEYPERLDRPYSKHIDLVKTLAAILRQVRKEFHPNVEARRLYLKSREPSCTVQNLKLDKCGPYEFISLVVPCICVDKWAIIDHRKVEYDKEIEDPKNRISNLRKFLERCMPTTLDEYCNPSLSEDILNARNKDQVLGRYEKKRIVATPSSDDKEHHRALLYELWILARAHMGELSQFVHKIFKLSKSQEKPPKTLKPTNVILVRQAWIWRIGEFVLMTELAPNWPDKGKLLMEWKHPKERIASFLSEIVGNLDSPIRGAKGSLLRTYENALIDISEEAKQYTKSARVEDIDLDKEKDIFHQISDLREELSMIKSVLTEQEEVWLEFLRLMWPNQGQDQQAGHHPSPDLLSQGSDQESDQELDHHPSRDSESELKSAKENTRWREFWQSRTKFDKYRRRMKKLDEDAERVEKNISTLMDLKQKHATIREAHSTALLSATVFGFTIITVIFAPLAFVAALFALPIDKFNEGKDGNNKDGAYSSGYIGKWSATAELVSIAVTLIAMWAGLRFAGLHVWGRRGLRDYIRQKANAIYTEETNKGKNSRDENNRDANTRDENKDENDRDENNSYENNGDKRNEDEINREAEKRQQTDGLGTRLQRVLKKRHIPGVRKSTNDVERG
ncbi:hypothetical protein HD806DRAFT_514353 [Xylariaceae sp. AK1471]|nr:hypothetical protein HD806DRAFT_514353 [Xylariaceae sp. AK1471]